MVISMPKLKKKKVKRIGQLKKLADKVFSEYIRQRDKGVCYTCGNVKPWKYQQCGHYVSRMFNSLRYSEVNCHCQDVACNVFRKGAMDEYAIRLVRQYGEGILNHLNIKKREIKQFSRPELEELIAKYKKLNG